MNITKKIRDILKVISGRLDHVDPGSFFIVVGALFGLLFLFITPPVAGLDEEQHFYRSYQVSDLNIKSDKVNAPNVYGEPGYGYGGSLPASVFYDVNKLRNSMNEDLSYQYNQVKDKIDTPLNQDSKVNVRFDNTAIYSPVPYIPQALGMSLGKAFNASPVVLSYLGRMAVLVVWLLAIYFAIRIIPIGKWVLVVLALNPASLFLASNLSGDAIAIASIALFTAVVLYTRTLKSRLSALKIVGILSLVLIIALQKNAYLPLVFVTLLIPSTVVSTRIKVAITVLGLLVGVAWNIAILSIASGIPDYFSLDQHISSHDQLLFILSHPLSFISILLWNIFGMPSILVAPGFVGLVSDTVLPFWIIILWWAVFVAAISIKDKSALVAKVQTPSARLSFGAIALAGIGATIASLYIGWNAVGSNEIQGVQPRYFIPLSFLLIPVLLNLKWKIEVKGVNVLRCIKISILIILLFAVLTMATRYIYGIR